MEDWCTMHNMRVRSRSVVVAFEKVYGKLSVTKK